jgi:hypothetical protein
VNGGWARGVECVSHFVVLVANAMIKQAKQSAAKVF